MINFGPATITWESTNQLVNGDFELWSSGNNANNWIFMTVGAGNGGSNNTQKYLGNYSARITTGNNATSYAYFQQTYVTTIRSKNYWPGKIATMRGYILSSNNNTACLQINDGVSNTQSNRHIGDNNWTYFTVTRTIANNANSFYALAIVTGTGLNAEITAFFDELSFVEGPYTLGKTFGGGSLQLYYHNSIGMYTKNLSSLIYGGEGVLHMFQWNNTFSFNNNSPMLYDYGKLTIACNNITYTIDCAKLFLAPSYSFGTFTQHPIDIHFSFKKSPDTGNYITIS